MNLIIIYQLKSDEQIVESLQSRLLNRGHTVSISKFRQDQNPISFIQELDLNKADRIVLFSTDKNTAKLINFLMNRRAFIVLNSKKLLSEYAHEGILSDDNFTYIINANIELPGTNKLESVFRYSNEEELVNKIQKIKFADNNIASANVNPIDPLFYELIAYRIKVAVTRLLRSYKKK